MDLTKAGQRPAADGVVRAVEAGDKTNEREEIIRLLHQSESRLAEAQRLTHIGHWEWEVAENTVTWSDELYRIYGLRPDEFAATYQGFLQRVHPEDREYVVQQVENAYLKGEPLDYYHRVVRPNGSVRLLHAFAQPIKDENGIVRRLIGVAQDITEEKALAQRLEKGVRQLTALNEMAQAIVATVDLPEILDRVLALLRPLLGVEATLLFLHDKAELVVSAVNREGVANLMGRRIPVDAGIAGDVWHSGQSLLLRGDACRRALAPQLLGPADNIPQAILAVPIHWQDRQLGVLEAVDSSPDAFTEEDLRLLETAAAWAAIAIVNAEQHQQLQRRLRESEAIAAIGRALTETIELGELLGLITRLACDVITNVDWAVIHLLQGDPPRLQLVAFSGLELGDRVYDLEPGQGIIGEVMGQGHIVNVPDMLADPRRLPIEDELQARCMLIAPVQGREQRLGTLSIQCETPAAFTADDERVLAILGIQAGMAIENARLYESEQRARKAAERRREGMRRLARQVVLAQEEERQRISRELHDETGQALTSFKIGLELIRSGMPAGMERTKEELAAMIELADKTMGNLRLLAHNLRPPGLDAFGLHATLAGLCQDFAGYTKIRVQYQGTEIKPHVLPLLTSLSLYRFVQEALTNAAKHAQATSIEVLLLQDAENVVLSVTDNGQGFEPPADLDSAEDLRGIGLRGMYERLIMIDGRLEIYAAPGKGTRLIARVPLMERV